MHSYTLFSKWHLQNWIWMIRYIKTSFIFISLSFSFSPYISKLWIILFISFILFLLCFSVTTSNHICTTIYMCDSTVMNRNKLNKKYIATSKYLSLIINLFYFSFFLILRLYSIYNHGYNPNRLAYMALIFLYTFHKYNIHLVKYTLSLSILFFWTQHAFALYRRHSFFIRCYCFKNLLLWYCILYLYMLFNL